MPALPTGTIQIQLWIDGESTGVSSTVAVPEEMVPVDDVLLDGR